MMRAANPRTAAIVPKRTFSVESLMACFKLLTRIGVGVGRVMLERVVGVERGIALTGVVKHWSWYNMVVEVGQSVVYCLANKKERP